MPYASPTPCPSSKPFTWKRKEVKTRKHRRCMCACPGGQQLLGLSHCTLQHTQGFCPGRQAVARAKVSALPGMCHRSPANTRLGSCCQALLLVLLSVGSQIRRDAVGFVGCFAFLWAQQGESILEVLSSALQSSAAWVMSSVGHCGVPRLCAGGHVPSGLHL